jgi:hypothetical protein
MAPKTMDLHPPALPQWSPLLSLLSSIIGACFWLVVVCKFIDRQPPKVTVYFLFDIFCIEFVASNDGRRPPTRSNPRAPPLQHLFYRSHHLLVDFCVLIDWRPPMADAPFSSLFFDVVYFGVPNGNQPAQRAITKCHAPDLDP